MKNLWNVWIFAKIFKADEKPLERLNISKIFKADEKHLEYELEYEIGE